MIDFGLIDEAGLKFFGVDAVYVPHGDAAPSTVRIIPDEPDEVTPLAGHALVLGTKTGRARVADLPKLTDGERMTIGAVTYAVQTPRQDALGILWTFDLVPF